MCALFGWLDYRHAISPKVLKKLTQALANAAEERGTDAAGISYIRDGRVVIYKRPKPAHKIRFNIPENTVAVMGHTRLTTQGNQKFNQNNHPFYGHADKNFAFAHNGVLYNDTELRKEKNLPDTHIETDSYVAVQLIEQQKKLDFDSLKNIAKRYRVILLSPFSTRKIRCISLKAVILCICSILKNWVFMSTHRQSQS